MKTDFSQEILTKPPVPSALQPAPGARAAGSPLRQDGQNPKAPSHSSRCLFCIWGLRSCSPALAVCEQTLSSSHSSRNCKEAGGHGEGCVAPPSPARLRPQLSSSPGGVFLSAGIFFIDGESQFPRKGLPSAEGCGNISRTCCANCLKTQPYGDDKRDQANLGFGS